MANQALTKRSTSDLDRPREVFQRIDAMILKAQAAAAVDPFRGLALAAKAQKAAKIWSQVAREAKSFAPITNRLIASRIRAERVAGQALQAIDRMPGRPVNNSFPERTNYQQALSEVGIGRTTASKWQRVFDVPDDQLEAYIADDRIDREKQLSTVELLRLAARVERDALRAQRRTAAAATAAADLGDERYGVEHGNFVDVAKDLPDGRVSMVFTDPPYHDKTLPVYADLGLVAARVLKDGGSLITYTSHHRIPEVISMLQAGGLTFFWPLAMLHTGPKARMTEYGIVVHWKPLLWFVKGKFRSRDDLRFVNDLIESAPEKDAHPWQQGTIEARYYIDALTHPGDLVFDPFCGGGTTAVAAKQINRAWLTCDVDESAVWIARQRLREVVA
jgi:hypothetical protein